MKQFQGQVIKLSADKTVSVKVDSWLQHPLYKKRVKKSKKYLVHDEKGVKVGQEVVFQEIAPISKRKKWKIAKIIK